MRWALTAIEVVVVILFVYLGAAVGGSVPMGPSTTIHAGRSVDVFLVSNGYHVDIVTPTDDAAMDWRPLLAASPITAPAQHAPLVAFGWGSRIAYTEVGTLSDLSLRKAALALAFDETVMHVAPIARVTEGLDVRRISLPVPDYEALAKKIEATFEKDQVGRSVPIAGATQGYGDAYFKALGRFSPFRTCNVWAGDMLRSPSTSVGSWTPFAGPLIRP